jgi:ATP-dependent DNA helicase RecG
MKSEEIIKDILSKDESVMLEFENSINKDAIAKTVCGFLNSSGGQLLVGVNDDKTVCGIKHVKEQADFLSRYLVNAIVPAAPIMVSEERFNGYEIILIEVYAGSRQPYVFSGSIYYRRDAKTVKATSDEISRLIHDRQKSELHWERQFLPFADLGDLDESEIRTTIRESIKNGRSTIEDENEIEKFLISQNLYENGHITNAAMILFGKEPRKFLPQSGVRLAVFKGPKTSNEFLHDYPFEGNLFKNIEKITSFFDVNIATKSRFSDTNWKRSDSTFPRLALREGVLNALIHRDYSTISSSALIGFYPDRLEITNYGVLPGDLTLADLKINHLSLPRNPDIAQICFLRGWIEKIGRGTLKIIDDCKDKGIAIPHWQIAGGATTLVFPGVTVIGQPSDGDNEGESDGIKEVVTYEIKNGEDEGVIEGLTDGVKEELRRAVAIIVDSPGLNTNVIAKSIGKSIPTTERYISILRQLGIIERKGASKTSGYHTSERIKKKLDTYKK